MKLKIKSLLYLFILGTSFYQPSFGQGLIPLVNGPGCLFNGKVYQNLIGTHTNGTPLFAGVEGNCPPYYSNPTTPPWQETGGNGSCTIWIDCQSSRKRSFKKGKIGEVNVPIDDYALPLTLLVSAVVFFRFKGQFIS